MTHGDKETPGNGPSEIRTPPGLGDSGDAEVSFPTPPRFVPSINTVTYLAGTECSQGSPDTGRSRTGCPVPAPRRTLGDPEPRPRAEWARARGSVREAQESSPPPSRRLEPPAQPALGARRWARGGSRVLRRCGPRSPRRGGVASLRGGASGGATLLRASVACIRGPGRPQPSREFPLRGRPDWAEQGGEWSLGHSCPARTTARPPCPGPSGDPCALLARKRILELGLAL